MTKLDSKRSEAKRQPKSTAVSKMETTINTEDMYSEEEYLSRISYLSRLYGKLTPEKKNVMKQFMADNDMLEVGEVLDYLQEIKAQ